jgi:hypothetical protein
MKYLIILLAGVLCNCTPKWSPESPGKQDENVLIHVECISNQQLESHVKQVLRSAHYNDIEVKDDGTILSIKVRYSKLSKEKADQIIDDLKRISGVLDALIIRDGVPVKNIN